MDNIEAMAEILSTANLIGGDMIAFLCLAFTIFTTLGTFIKASLIQRLQRAWASALGSFVVGLAMAISHALTLPQQSTLFFNIKPLSLLLIYAVCIILLSLCAIKQSEKYRYSKRKTP
jgi:uncharacterized membrane protein YjfL (UPF0719 family)